MELNKTKIKQARRIQEKLEASLLSRIEGIHDATVEINNNWWLRIVCGKLLDKLYNKRETLLDAITYIGHFTIHDDSCVTYDNCHVIDSAIKYAKYKEKYLKSIKLFYDKNNNSEILTDNYLEHVDIFLTALDEVFGVE